MDERRLWFLLSEVAAGLDIEVRLENLADDEEYQARGGLCRLAGRRVIFVDRRLPVEQRCRQLGRGLVGLDLDAIYLKPVVRAYLDELGAGKTGKED